MCNLKLKQKKQQYCQIFLQNINSQIVRGGGGKSTRHILFIFLFNKGIVKKTYSEYSLIMN